MKTLIITVAGTATRFNQDTETDTLKCLYYKGEPRYSLLYQILDKSRDFDKYIIVGGYLFGKLINFVEEFLSEFRPKIELVYNSYYKTYGSGYSLLKGIEAITDNCGEVVFVEGDLFYDAYSFKRVLDTSRDTITVNSEFITSQKAVALYADMRGYIHYLYDTQHHELCISEPFQAIYNSAQIWKFLSLEKLRSVIASLTPVQLQGTNLEIIQGYFGDISLDMLELVPIKIWVNCNTVSDYNMVYSLIKDEVIK